VRRLHLVENSLICSSTVISRSLYFCLITSENRAHRLVHCFPSYWLIRSVHACWADSASNTISNAPSSKLWVNKAIARSSAWLNNMRLFSILLSSSDMGSASGLGTDKTSCIFNNLRYTLASRLQRGKLLPSVSWVLRVGMVIRFGDSSVIFFLFEILCVK
jgi:hypothetical protein